MILISLLAVPIQRHIAVCRLRIGGAYRLVNKNVYQVKEGDAAVWAGLIFPLSGEDTSVAFWSPPTEANIFLYSFLMPHYVAIYRPAS